MAMTILNRGQTMNRYRLVIATLFIYTLATVTARQNHFGDPCYLCRCFVEYTDRDVAIPIRPYAMAADGYDTTEDRCLATCRRDEKCRVAVYGMIGGRKVFTCEFYEKIDSRNSPKYSPFVNIYIKKGSCPFKDDIFESVKMIPADNSSLKRRLKHEKLAQRPNPHEG